MKFRAFLFISCVALLAGVGAHAAAKPQLPGLKNQPAAPEGPKIRVLLEKNIFSALLEAKGEYAVLNKATGAVLSSGQLGKRFVVHALQEGLRWGEEYPDVFQIAIVPRSPSTMLYIDGIQYKGTIAVYHCKDKQIAIVNEVPIEDYVKSILSVEINGKLSKEALSALVIAARTEAFAQVKGNVSKKPWDVTAQEVNYFGHGVTCRKNDVELAVDWTRFMVLESPNSGLVQKLPLTQGKAQELADQGFDAKKILEAACPSGKLSVTELPKQRIIR